MCVLGLRAPSGQPAPLPAPPLPSGWASGTEASELSQPYTSDLVTEAQVQSW